MPPCALRLGPLGPVKVTIVKIVHWNHTNEFTKNKTKNLQKSIQNPPKIFPKSPQNAFQIHPKCCQNSLLDLSWAVLAASWAILAPRGPQERNKIEKPELGPPIQASILGGFSSHVGTLLGHVALQERMETTSCELINETLHLRRQLDPTWLQVKPT